MCLRRPSHRWLFVFLQCLIIILVVILAFNYNSKAPVTSSRDLVAPIVGDHSPGALTASSLHDDPPGALRSSEVRQLMYLLHKLSVSLNATQPAAGGQPAKELQLQDMIARLGHVHEDTQPSVNQHGHPTIAVDGIHEAQVRIGDEAHEKVSEESDRHQNDLHDNGTKSGLPMTSLSNNSADLQPPPEGASNLATEPERVPQELQENVVVEKSELWKLSVGGDSEHPCVVDCLTGQPVKCHSPGFHSTPLEIDLPTGVRENTIHRKDSFTQIFHQRIWLGPNTPRDPGVSDIQSSGMGSLLASSHKIRSILNRVLDEIKVMTGKAVVTMLDVPCGDMVWMEQFLTTRPDVHYVGMDIVSQLIQHHTLKYQRHPNWKFIQGDIVTAHVINQHYDLVFTRHMTQHLTNEDTNRVLKHISDSGASFLLASTYPKVTKNDEIFLNAGRHRQQNFEIPPYKLTPPICMTEDIRAPEDCHSALWRLPLTQIETCGSPTSPLFISHQGNLVSCA